MKRSFLTKYIISFLCLLMALCLMSSSAFASDVKNEDQACSITLTFENDDKAISNAHFRLYRIARSAAELENANFIGDFNDYQITVDSPLDVEALSTLAATLSSYAARDALVPNYQGDTDSKGRIIFENLEPGVYLIDGNSVKDANGVYNPQPFIVVLPAVIDGEEHKDVSSKVKYEYIPSDAETISRKVIKVWDDKNYPDRPLEISVQLLCDGQVQSEVALNSENNWRYTWDDLDPSKTWQVVEKDVPDGYSVSISREGEIFVVTNKYEEDIPEGGWPSEPSSSRPTNPDKEPTTSGSGKEENLPNTGLLWWPVPVLLTSGFALFSVGFVKRKRDED